MLERIWSLLVVWSIPPLLLGARSRFSVRCVGVLAVCLTSVISPYAFRSVGAAIAAACLSGAIGIVSELGAPPAGTRRVTRLALTVPCMFLLPSALLPEAAGAFHVRGAETLVIALTSVSSSESLRDLWTTWAVSPSLSGASVRRPTTHAWADARRGLIMAIGMLILAQWDLVADTRWTQPHVELVRTMTTVMLVMPAVGWIRRASCLLGGFDPGPGFVSPVLAPNISEFWRRWNVWYGNAFGSLVFVPTIRVLRRTFPRIPQEVTVVVATIGTFGTVGMHHDLCRNLVATASGAWAWSPDCYRTILLFFGLGTATAMDSVVSRRDGSWRTKLVRAVSAGGVAAACIEFIAR